ncbi:13317_t:CDS:1, partial [Dentiscutata heterogama]
IQQEKIQQKEIIEIEDSQKIKSVEFDTLLQRCSGISNILENITFKSSTNISISEISKEKEKSTEEIESQTELEKDN